MRRVVIVVICLLAVSCRASTPTGDVGAEGLQPDPTASTTAISTSPESPLPESPSPGGSSLGTQSSGPQTSESPNESPGQPTGTTDAGASLRPPRPGTYTYTQSGSQRFGALEFDFSPEGTLTIEDASQSSSGAKQEASRKYSANFSTDTTIAYARQQARLVEIVERSTIAGNTRESKCRTEVPLLILQLPLKESSSWADTGQCADMAVTYSAKVENFETVRMGEVDVSAVLIRAESEAKSPSVSQATTMSIWYSVEHRLILRLVSSSVGEIDGTPIARDLEETLKSLDPA